MVESSRVDCGVDQACLRQHETPDAALAEQIDDGGGLWPVRGACAVAVALGKNFRLLCVGEPGNMLRRAVPDRPGDEPDESDRAKDEKGRAPVERTHQGRRENCPDRGPGGRPAVEQRRDKAALAFRKPVADHAAAGGECRGFACTHDESCEKDRDETAGRSRQRRCRRPDRNSAADHVPGADPFDQNPEWDQAHHIGPEEAGKKVPHLHGGESELGDDGLGRNRQRDAIDVIDDDDREDQ
jgi:hypothetical protein